MATSEQWQQSDSGQWQQVDRGNKGTLATSGQWLQWASGNKWTVVTMGQWQESGQWSGQQGAMATKGQYWNGQNKETKKQKNRRTTDATMHFNGSCVARAYVPVRAAVLSGHIIHTLAVEVTAVLPGLTGGVRVALVHTHVPCGQNQDSCTNSQTGSA